MKSLLTVLVALCFSSSLAFAAAPVVIITMKSLSYDPKIAQVKVGQKVRWKNTAYTEHSATSDDATPVFDTGMVEPGKSSKEVTFKKSGSYSYHCTLHGTTMSGTINVVAEQADAP
jgi:plastocyanin